METPLPLRDWTDFYVIVGSSAGALTGLQFVVIALITDRQAARSMTEIRAFGTPTVVHFCMALIVSAIVCAPWRFIVSPAICLGFAGVGGVIYASRVLGHAKRQTGYTPDLEDRWWYLMFPLISYAALSCAAIALVWHPRVMLFVVAAVALSLLLIGIHNAWDTVTYVALKPSAGGDNASLSS